MKLVARPKGPFGLIDKVHRLQSQMAKAYGQPTDAMRTDLVRDGKKVIFLHNPKTAGKSLREFLHVKRHSHSLASDRLSEKNWLNTYSVVAVREPFERFLSGYYDRIFKQADNALVKIYGPEVKNITPFEYLEIIKESKIFGGIQTRWTDYPSAAKPRADLILRYEDIGNWKATMVAAGLEVADRPFLHLNRSKRAQSDHLVTLKMTQPEFKRLQDAVYTHFAEDYRTFGYPPSPLTPNPPI